MVDDDNDDVEVEPLGPVRPEVPEDVPVSPTVHTRVLPVLGIRLLDGWGDSSTDIASEERFPVLLTSNWSTLTPVSGNSY